LAVSATLDHRPAGIPQVPVQPLLPQHRDERRQERHQETRIHQARRGHDLARWTFLNGRNGGGLAGNGGLVESEEDGAEEGGRLLVGIGLEIRMDVDDEGGADGREQAGLQE
jgi:hypothetical protein